MSYDPRHVVDLQRRVHQLRKSRRSDFWIGVAVGVATCAAVAGAMYLRGVWGVLP